MSAELFSVGDDEGLAANEQNDEVPVSDYARPTDWLAKIDSDPAAEEKLAEYMLGLARGLAAQRIGPNPRAGVGPTDVAVSAVLSLLDDLKARAFQPADSTSLLRALSTRIRNKAVDALRRRHAGKRDVGREVPMTPMVPDTEDSPVDIAIVNELTKRVVTLIEQEPDELRRLVTYLGLIEGQKAAKISAAIEECVQPSNVHVPSIRSIQLWLSAARTRIEASLREEGFLDEEQ